MPKSQSVTRYDFRKIQKARKNDNGFLIAPVNFTRSGVFTYVTKDGNVIREYRPEQEVFNKDSMESLMFVPVTNRHPKHGLVTTKTAKKDGVGSVGENIQQDGKFLAGNVVITDEVAIEAIENDGIQEVSCGYKADLEFSPGTTPDGEKYDAIQTNIRYNHVALVRRGRAGPKARLILDDASAILDDGEINLDEIVFNDESKQRKKEGVMPKIKLDGLEYEVDPALAQSFKAEMNTRVDEAKEKMVKEKDEEMEMKKKKDKEKMDELQAKLDAANEALEKAKSEKMDQAQLNEMIKARTTLLDAAKPLVSKETKLDDMTDAEIRAEVVKQNCKVDEEQLKSEVYVQARYDGIVETKKTKKDTQDPIRATMQTKVSKEDEGELDADAIRQKRMDEDAKSWETPIGKHLN